MDRDDYLAECEARDAAALAAAEGVEPITTWQEVAELCDDETWQRILDDLSPKSRAEALAVRPVSTGNESAA